MTSANLLIVVLVGAVVGALVGLALGGALSGFYLAVVAGFLGTIVAGVARNEIMKRSGAGHDDSKISQSRADLFGGRFARRSSLATGSFGSAGGSIHRSGSARSRDSSPASCSRC